MRTDTAAIDHRTTLIERLWAAADDRDIDEVYRFVTELVAFSCAAASVATVWNLFN